MKGTMKTNKLKHGSSESFEPTRVWNRKFVALLIIDTVVIVGNFMVRPIIAAYAVELGATFAVAGLVSGMSWAIATLLRPATG